MLNLVLAIFWLGVGCVLLFAYLTGQKPPYLNEQAAPLLGGLALLLSLYNFVRWWAARASARARARQAEREPRRRRSDSPPVEYDPTFDFNRPEPPQQ